MSDLRGTGFASASASATNFAYLDLSVAIGLETINHQRPSTIGIDTIYKSGGKIPEVFLRGCGVPDEFIAYIGSMVGRPIEFYSCFISYSTKDQEFAKQLHTDLQAKGMNLRQPLRLLLFAIFTSAAPANPGRAFVGTNL